MRSTLFMGLLYFIAKASPPLYLIKKPRSEKKIHVTSKRANFLSKILNLKVTQVKSWLLRFTVKMNFLGNGKWNP